MLTLDRLIARTEVRLREETRDKADKVAETTDDAQRTAAGSLAIALLLATLIAIWLTRSISRPVYDLEKGMKAVADGDFTHRLPMAESRNDEFGRLAGSYQRMASQLAELDKLKAEFVSVASHELKTPINVIVGYLELLQENIYGELNPKQREICATLGKQAQTLTRLVKRLLDISRFEAGGGKLERRQIDLDRFLHAFESSFQVLALQREISFRVVRGDNLPAHVLWDEDRINEVLGNLLSNAFKFTDRGGTVELAVEGVDNEVTITVRDSGAGIPAEQLPHIFEKFYQASNQAQSSARGTGPRLGDCKGDRRGPRGDDLGVQQCGRRHDVHDHPSGTGGGHSQDAVPAHTGSGGSRLTRRALIAIALIAAACGKQPAAAPAPTPAAGFAGAVEAARQQVDAGDYTAADRILAEYATSRFGNSGSARDLVLAGDVHRRSGESHGVDRAGNPRTGHLPGD